MQQARILAKEGAKGEFAVVFAQDHEIAPYRTYCRTSPKRIVRVIRNERGQMNPDDNVFAALAAVAELVRGSAPGQDKVSAWHKLVDAGIVDALTDNMLKATFSELEFPSNTPERIKERTKLETNAPYYDALEILANASRFTQSGKLAKQDKLLVSTVKSKWSRIMDRLWEEPFQTLRPEPIHALERRSAGILMNWMLEADNSLIETAYSDRTIAVLTRYWAHAGSCKTDKLDSYILTMALCALVPDAPQHRAWFKSHREYTMERLLGQLCIGASWNIPNASRPDQIEAVLDMLGSRFELFNGTELEQTLMIAMSMMFQEEMDDLKNASTERPQFWRGLFSIPPRIANGVQGSGGQQTRKMYMLFPFNAVDMILRNAPKPLYGELMTMFIDAGLFDVLDEVVEDLMRLTERGNGHDPAEMLSDLWLRLLRCTSDTFCPTSTKALLRTQFPRWHTLHTFLMHDVRSQQAQGPSPRRPPPANAHPAVQSCWQFFLFVQTVCKPPELCARRGCEGEGKARCGTCKGVMYCGSECQKSDWKAHKPLCGDNGLMKLIARSVGPDSAVQMAEMLSKDEDFEKVVRGMSYMNMNARSPGGSR